MASLTTKETKDDDDDDKDVIADLEYEKMTIDALTELRKRLQLDPEHDINPALLEPPIFDVTLGCGVCPRSKRKYRKNSNIDNSSNGKEPLLPCHFRLFPIQFISSQAPFDKDVNATLCRFLRARDYDVDKAVEMFTNAVEIRREHGAADILKKRDPNEPTWQHGTPHYHYGHDKLGRPFYIEMSGRVRVGKLMEPTGYMNFDDFTKRHIIHMEYMSRRIEHASKRYGEHVTQLSQIMDLEGLSYFDDSRGMQLFKDAINMDQNVYPEYLGNLFLINAPLIFRGMWVIIRKWIEAKTAAKFHVLGSDYLPTLLQYIDIHELPVEYGGTNTLSLPTVNFDLVPKERPTEYVGVHGLNEDGTVSGLDSKKKTDVEAVAVDDDEEVTF
jgi:hypothetical protein